MKRAPSLFLCALCPLSSFPLFFFPPPPTLCLIPPIPLPCFYKALHPHSDNIFHCFSPLSRGAGVLSALPLVSERAAGSGQGSLRTGFRPGCCPPLRTPLRPSTCTHPAPASPGRVGPRVTKVHGLALPTIPSNLLMRVCGHLNTGNMWTAMSQSVMTSGWK